MGYSNLKLIFIIMASLFTLVQVSYGLKCLRCVELGPTVGHLCHLDVGLSVKTKTCEANETYCKTDDIPSTGLFSARPVDKREFDCAETCDVVDAEDKCCQDDMCNLPASSSQLRTYSTIPIILTIFAIVAAQIGTSL